MGPSRALLCLVPTTERFLNDNISGAHSLQLYPILSNRRFTCIPATFIGPWVPRSYSNRILVGRVWLHLTVNNRQFLRNDYLNVYVWQRRMSPGPQRWVLADISIP